ncbi:hypothetical protein RRG08_033981 [Elysia crispata]|uniref:Uncharacterized protein n=1 Tax=Elysia crispata TaxID=231223 RepID=A0AAE1D485_9GAST|nr:hypothetical protein RRG08_033981 [Elysia crispata]
MTQHPISRELWERWNHSFQFRSLFWGGLGMIVIQVIGMAIESLDTPVVNHCPTAKPSHCPAGHSRNRAAPDFFTALFSFPVSPEDCVQPISGNR